MSLSVTTRHNLRLIKLESIVTFYVLGAVETAYLQAKGYTLGQVGTVYVIQVAALMLTNVPTGYLADKTSRRMCNLIGDALAATGIIGLALADNLIVIVLTNVVTGLGFSLSGGADTALLKAVCDHLKEPLAKHLALTQSARTALMVIGGVIAGFVTVRQPTVGILLCSVPFLLGTLVSYFIKEVKAPAEPATKAMKDALRYCWTIKKIRWTIVTGSILGSIAGIIQDLAVPLAQAGELPPLLVSSAWSCYFLAWSLGAWLYRKAADAWNKWFLLMLPLSVVAAALGTVAIAINEWTILAFLVIGFAHGWVAPQLSVIATEAAPSELRATIISVYMTVTQLVFIATTLIVFNVATANIGLAIVIVFLAFTPALLFWSRKLTRIV